ncbi:MAG TPA: hypothetical protein PKZ29_01650 [Candidatus Woesebacteria bacterium]|nr:hypothetical protein [Candidatus Woesebacteria bacterium]HOG37608.1 hypothetical protein [Candidatus Woesebacteria bacterium]
MNKKILWLGLVILVIIGASVYLRGRGKIIPNNEDNTPKKIEVKKMPYNGSKKACDVMSPEIAEALFSPVVKPVENNGDDRVCVYADKEKLGISHYVLMMSVGTARDEDYKRYEDKNYKKVEGLGEVAYWDESRSVLDIRAGDTSYKIGYQANGPSTLQTVRPVAELIKERFLK